MSTLNQALERAALAKRALAQRKAQSRLSGMTIQEVSLVDRAANGARFLLTKRQQDAFEAMREIARTLPDDPPAAPDVAAIVERARQRLRELAKRL